MRASIHPIKLGVDHCYVIRGEGTIMIDGGGPNQAGSLEKALASLSIELPLIGYGIPGKILYTPGHSMGSVSVLLETGDAFVGDLAMNGFPLRYGPGLPIFAEDMQMVRESWRLLVDAGAETIYPAHGKPFSVDFIRRAL